MSPSISSGIAVALVALLVISTTAGAYFYYLDQQAVQSKDTYVSELSSATGEYSALAANYNSSVSLNNKTLALLAGAVGQINTTLPAYQQASQQLSQLWARYLALKPPAGSIYTADILLDFGNGTLDWFNNTKVQPGWNLYTETVVLTNGNLEAQWYPSFGEHLVLGLDGVSDTATKSWFLWGYNSTASWQPSSLGADDLTVYNRSVFAWTYCPETASYTPQCTP